MKRSILLSVLLIFVASNIYAQSSASATATVLAQLKKGLSISLVGGNLDFGEIILNGSPQTPSIAPSAGANFRIIGHPNKNVTITFNNVTLNNNAWVSSNGGTNGTMVFTPSIKQTGSSSTYESATDVVSGNSIPLVNVSGDGYLYLWVGGSLSIAANQPHGDYTGTFSITVAY
ncbi:MAG: DUF4402 domain-containing protein [Ignavibacteria bacterium]|nr:DUF4402 domain-containing protein [Ignavibacteria bacterium]